MRRSPPPWNMLQQQRLTFADHCCRHEDQLVKHLVLWKAQAGKMLREQGSRITSVKRLLRDSCCETVGEFQQKTKKSARVGMSIKKRVPNDCKVFADE